MTESQKVHPGPVGAAACETGDTDLPYEYTETLFPVPRLGAGLQFLGEYQGSGSTERKYLVRRGDGQVVQLSRLLYLVAEAIDGTRNTETVSHRVSGRYGREVSADNVEYLIEQKLEPLGITVPFGQEGDQVAGPTTDLLLVLKGHRVIFRERQVARIAKALAWLHRPPVVVLVLSAALGVDVWLFAVHGAIGPVLQVLEQPVLMLAVFVLIVASLVFHEFGHASACRYGGARPGSIGCGLFLIWPSMYTEVTDVYRIGRAGRIRTDLGGIYFNIVFVLGLALGYLLTGQPLFLAAIYLVHFEILEQLLPVVRLDGYYILGDLAGIPDLFGKIKPILQSMLPGRPVSPEVAGLKRPARVMVTAWVVTMVPLIVAELGYVLWNLPRLLGTSLRSLAEQVAGTWSAFADGQISAGLVGVVGSFMLICPLAGATYLAVRLVGRLVKVTARATEGNTRLRVAICGGALVGASALCAAWLAGVTPEPLPRQPPIAPILQPGVPTARTTAAAPAEVRSTPATPDPTVLTSPLPGAGAPSASAEASGPAAGASVSPSASPVGVVPTAVPTSPTPSPSRTSASPSASPSTSPTPSATPSGSPSPSVTPSQSPSETEAP
ncbi:M50 family metallopeptidase [Streptomyces wuyuanensis]|uniref:Putative peptide zinc metalloprotease protein n=1 Tax=Streptomyces wuyuanensis TaxID=1196353 RepID=A0A1H0EIF9_9ACTN|nr:M50 family metallopeptidase [Streptomyces wuyuanensis]SDN82244.1 putative peptide zinc metalloprotease protein [Streptomyces wuyuanensis]